MDLNGGRDWRVCWSILRSGSCRLCLHDRCGLAKDGTPAEKMALEEGDNDLTRKGTTTVYVGLQVFLQKFGQVLRLGIIYSFIHAK